MPENPVYIVAQPESKDSTKQLLGLAILAGCGWLLWKELKRTETATANLNSKTY